MDFIQTLQGCTIILNGLFWIVSNKEWTYKDFTRLHNNFEWTILDNKQQRMYFIYIPQGYTIILNGLFWRVSNKKWTL
jgi:hypothetical protein